MEKILIVDDDPNILLSLEFLLRKSGYQVFVAIDGEEAIALVETEKPNLVLLDIMMPKVNGYEVCEFIRSKTEWNFMKIIILSAKSKHTDMDLAYEKGADRYLVKPFSTKDLLENIKDLLGESKDAKNEKLED
ncbi:response regulator transcription factor [Olivibacter sitiensis]|uniref:response regulator transcription factor n=1 Tax=Olivibacter sitiensis TaxID=376470 RepID=UPI0003F53AA5|nr:response regulator [Olivibacter sitiensis]